MLVPKGVGFRVINTGAAFLNSSSVLPYEEVYVLVVLHLAFVDH